MEEPVSSTELEYSQSLSAHDLVIVYTPDAQEWAMYLQQIMKSSWEFHTRSILLYMISPADECYDFEYFQSCKCLVLLLTGALLDMLLDPELHGALQRHLYPPHRVVALLCGVSEDSVLTESFEDWPSWRKLFAEDEPDVYISTILDSITDCDGVETEPEHEATAAAELHDTENFSSENSTSYETEEVDSGEQKETVSEDEELSSTGNSTAEEGGTPTPLTCLTVQPSRVLCGESETLFIIFTNKLDDQSAPEVEFSSEDVSARRVQSTVENEYTLSVTAPDMPAGVVSLTMYTDQSCVSLRPVTYYTYMEEARRYLENVADPVDLICEAFNLSSNSRESLQNMLTDSLKSRMPETSLQLFGITQMEEDNMAMNYSDCSEDIYESMLQIDPGCAEDLYEVMNAVEENPEEAMLRRFFQAKPHASVNQENKFLQSEEAEKDDHNDIYATEEEEDPYNLCPEDIYDTVDTKSTYNPVILNRPPAPIPRPESESEPEQPMISRVFSDKRSTIRNTIMDTGGPAARPWVDAPSSDYDSYDWIKTPGQKQLISLQERVKVGEITVDEAVQEFKAWQFDHERRASSIRYQQENLKRLRDSITRRHKERQKAGKELDYEISAPLQRNSYWGSSMTLECSVYESAPRMVAPPPPPPVTQIIQRSSWKTGSTSSTSSTESNRLSTHSNFSYSSGTEPDLEDTIENLPPPPRPPRPSDIAAFTPPPRIPPRVPERVPEKMLHERYISCPTRALPQRPSQRHRNSAPPVPRRLR